jgi:hypothetical protein
MTLRSRLMMSMIALGWCGCAATSSPTTQVVTGTVSASDAIAVRAVVDDQVVTATQVRSDGSFSLSLPAGKAYRLEVLSSLGVQHVRQATGADLKFRVCVPGDPWNVGTVGPNSGDGSGRPPGGPGGPGDGSCGGPPPPPNGGPPPPPMGGSDSGPPPPNGGPPPPMGGSDSGPPPPMGGSDGGPPPPPNGSGTDPGDGSAMPPRGTDPNGHPCPPPPAPCADPTDPNTCQDPCVDDAPSCGCASGDPACWPAPGPACAPDDPSCDPGGPIGPQNPPGDFGCDGGSGSASGAGTDPSAP